MVSKIKMFFFQKGPDSSVVEHLHGKQAAVGSIPILGKSVKKTILKITAAFGGI
jgi:hypothetical protein